MTVMIDMPAYLTRLDSKGRMPIPIRIRNILRLDYGDKLRVFTQGKKEIKLIHQDAGDIRIKAAVKSFPDLKKLIDVIEDIGMKIMSTECYAASDGMQWSAVIDSNNNAKNLKKLRETASAITKSVAVTVV